MVTRLKSRRPYTHGIDVIADRLRQQVEVHNDSSPSGGRLITDPADWSCFTAVARQQNLTFDSLPPHRLDFGPGLWLLRLDGLGLMQFGGADGHGLVLTRVEWNVLVARVRRGEFDF